MRIAVVVALLIAGCAEDDGGGPCDHSPIDMTECHEGTPGCTDSCTWERVTHTLSWSFTNSTTGVTAPCLPGAPFVTIFLGRALTSASCDAGAASITVPVNVETGETYLSSGGIESARVGVIHGVVAVPKFDVVWNGGYVRAHWRVEDALGDSACAAVASNAVNLRVDDMPIWQSTNYCEKDQALAGPLTAGVHTIRAEASSTVGDYMSSSFDITISNGEVVDSSALVIPLY